MAVLELKPASECRWDAAALGEQIPDPLPVRDSPQTRHDGVHVAESQVDSARVLDAHLNCMEDERRDLYATLRDLRSSEGYDVLLSDFLRDAYDRM